MRRRRLVLLGATGSIGESTLKVLRAHSDRLELVGIAAKSNFEKLAAIAREFSVPHIGLFDPEAHDRARDSGIFGPETILHRGIEGLQEMAALPDCDTVLVAVVGTHGLLPALEALERGKTLAVASKEILVLAGKFIMEAARRSGASILPVDSEHNAIFQCLEACEPSHIDKLILTASGGSFRDLPLERFADVTVEQALNHPNWDMGPKVTIDAATMANKGLEMIEARWLFGVQPSQVQAVIHPQSIAHSMVQFVDGSILAQLAPPDMTFAIQHCLLHPERAPGASEALDFSQAMQLDFRSPDLERYPCLVLARQAMEASGMAPGIFNAANEIAVEAFVARKIKFVEIATVIEKTLQSVDYTEPESLEAVLGYDQLARDKAAAVVREGF